MISENIQYILIISVDQIIQILYGQNFSESKSLTLPQNNLIINDIYYSNQDFLFIKQSNLLQLIQINSINPSSYSLKLTQSQIISCSGKSDTISYNNTVFLFCENNQIYYIKVNNIQGNFTTIQQQRSLMNQVLLNHKSQFLTSNVVFSYSYNGQQLYVVRDDHLDLIGLISYVALKSYKFINNFSYSDDIILHLKMIYASDNVLSLINTSIILTDDIANHNNNIQCQTQIQYNSEVLVQSQMKAIQNGYQQFLNYQSISQFYVNIYFKEFTILNTPFSFKFQSQCTTYLIGQGNLKYVKIQLTTNFLENMLQMQGLSFQNVELLFQLNTNQTQTFYLFNNLQYLGMNNILLSNLTNLYVNITDIETVNIQNIQFTNQKLNFILYPIIYFQNITNLSIQYLNISDCYFNSEDESSLIFINQSKNVSLNQINAIQNKINITFLLFLNQIQNILATNSNVSHNYPIKQFVTKQNQYNIPSQFISINLVDYCFIDTIYFQNNKGLVFFSYFNFQEFIINGSINATYTLLNDIFIAQNLFINNNYNTYSMIYLKSKNSTFQGVFIQNNTVDNNDLVRFDNSQVILKGSLIQENKALQSSQFYSISSSIFITDTVFSDNSQKDSVLFLSKSYTTILRSNFTSNLSYNDGACIYVDNQDYLMNSTSSYFLGDSLYLTKNQAQGSGGAILFNCINCIIQNSVFEQNSAIIGGGFRYIRVIPVFLQSKNSLNQDSCGTFNNNNCLNNIAYFYGNNFASYPKKIDFIYQNSTLNSSDIKLDNMRSGQDKINITVLMKDENQQILFLQQGDFQKSSNIINEIQNFKSKIQTISQSEREIKIDGSTIAEFSSSEFQFSQLTVSGIPGSQQRLTLIVSGIFSLLNETHFDLITAQNYSIHVQFRECKIGEIYTKLCSSCPIYQCLICEQGTFSLVQPIKDSNQSCLQCDYTTSVSCQQNQIQIKQGFWRQNNSSNLIEKCINSVQNCNGDQTTNYCAQGYIGPLCEVCDNLGETWGSKYGKSFLNNYQCLKCYNLNDSIYIFIFSLIIIFYSTYTIWKLVNQSNTRIVCYYMMKLNILKMGKTAVVGETTLYFKQFIHQLQVLFCLQNLNLEFGSLFEVSNKFVIPLSTNIHSLDCFLTEISNQVPMYVTRLIWATIIPFILYFITILFYYIIARIKRQNDQGEHSFNIQHKYFTKTAAIFFIFIMQQGIIDSLIQIVSCRQIGGKYYIQFQVSEECYTEEHKKVLFYFATPLLFSWVLALPMIILVILFLKRDRLHNHIQTIKIYSFFYFGYKRKYFFWEFVKIILRISLVFTSNYFSQQQVNLGQYLLLISLIYLFLLSNVEPYYSKILNRIEIRSQKLICIIFLLCNISQNLTDLIFKKIFIILSYLLIIFLSYTLVSAILINLLINHNQSFMKISCVSKIKNFIKQNLTLKQKMLVKKYFPQFYIFVWNSDIISSFSKFKHWQILRVKVSQFLKRKQQNQSFSFTDTQNPNLIYNMSEQNVNQNTDFRLIGQRPFAISFLNQRSLPQNKPIGNTLLEKQQQQQYNLNMVDTVIDDKFLEESDKSGIFIFDESQTKVSQVKDSFIGPFYRRIHGKTPFEIQSPLTANQLLFNNKTPEKISSSQEETSTYQTHQ
ncbi:transmembrane protein, putative (macronuclear) [Tetrahymena thermophila SB210]|uniref:Transmembrane protein, putative n=1 Tax=Tetrahymena thermophila (strain SB210) TaxID=312017 RepID=Q22BB8_TETTS|nr:transmembrane protein, putative [Tetrahymena thermophila SB210]EAR82590.2 transmembrane protein, putative [Tetrahymena thermophila SB210]|eukprot:XP_001030253.2 transmembrane protein, putative [Tetrahymena thermophila SB210]